MFKKSIPKFIIYDQKYDQNFLNIDNQDIYSINGHKYESNYFKVNQKSTESTNDTVLRESYESFKNHNKEKIIDALLLNDFEYGYNSTSEFIIQSLFKENSIFTKDLLNDIFISNFDNKIIIIGLLKTIAHFEYTDISPIGPTMALAALSYSDPEVQECGIRAYENWGHADSLKVLNKIKCEQEWLSQYINQVIEILEEELIIYGTTCTKN